MDVNFNTPFDGIPNEVLYLGMLLIFLLLLFLIKKSFDKNPKTISILKRGDNAVVKIDYYKEGPGEYFGDIEKSPNIEMKKAFDYGLELYRESQYKEALRHFEDALTKNPSNEEKVATFHTMGACNYHLGNFDIAKEQFKFVLDHTKEASAKAAALGNLGNVYANKGEPEKALKHLKAALKIQKEIGHRLGEAAALGNIGIIYKNKGELDKALKYYEAALKIHREIDYLLGAAKQLGNIGNVYVDKGELDNALKYYEAALKIFKELGAINLIERAERNIAKIKAKK